MPCHAAGVIPGLRFDNVKERSIREIWESSEAFKRFRGEDWMQEPCKTCERRTRDFGGCRCQAMLLAGDAALTDPVCSLSPQRERVDAILAAIPALTGQPARHTGGRAPALVQPPWLYRSNPT